MTTSETDKECWEAICPFCDQATVVHIKELDGMERRGVPNSKLVFRSYTQKRRCPHYLGTFYARWCDYFGAMFYRSAEQYDMKINGGRSVRPIVELCRGCDVIQRVFIAPIARRPSFKNESCLNCGLEYPVVTHHIDGNRKNNNPSNKMPLCPNCHFKWHQGGLTESEIDSLKQLWAHRHTMLKFTKVPALPAAIAERPEAPAIVNEVEVK
jgi:hypothetical protein